MVQYDVPVTKAVEQIIHEMPLLQDAFNRQVVNYSALSREIKPEVERICGRTVSLEAILVALSKQVPGAFGQIEQHQAQLMAGVEISMRSGVVDVCLARNPPVFAALSALSKQVDWSRGELLCIIQCTGEMAVLADRATHEKLTALIEKEHTLSQAEDLCMITLRFSADEFLSSPGAINHFTQLLHRHGINLVELETAFKELDFLVAEKDGPRVYELFTREIHRSREKTAQAKNGKSAAGLNRGRKR